MSIITIEQFEELSEDYPELAKCYNLDYTFTTHSRKDAEEVEPIAYTS